MTGRGPATGGATLRSERFLLEPLDPERDAPDLFGALGDRDAMRFWDSRPVDDVAGAALRLAGYLEAPGAAHWVVRERAHGPALGMVGVLSGGEVPGVQWIVVPQRWSEGVASEATAAMVEHLAAGGVTRLEAWIETSNRASAAVARRAGFVPRGRLVQRFEHRGGAHESTVWAWEDAPAPVAVTAAVAELAVRDPRATADLLVRVFDGRTLAEDGDLVIVGLDHWSGSARVHLLRAGMLDRVLGRPVDLRVEISSDVDGLVDRATASGLRCRRAPRVEPWGRREAVLALSEGHRLTVSSPA